MFYKRKQQFVVSNKTNEQITAAELRVVDDDGQSLGVLSKEAALTLAREKGLDLIEISPQANPPVARIASFDKFRYQQERAAKKQQQAQKGQEMKRVRVGARTAQNDLNIKARQINKFLAEGHKVEIQQVLRGREKANKDWALQKLKEFLTIIEPGYKIISEPRYGGRGFNVTVAK